MDTEITNAVKETMDKMPPHPGIMNFVSNNPWIIAVLGVLLIAAIVAIIWLFMKNAKGLKVGDFQVDFSKAESVNGDSGANAEAINEAKRQVEERTRYIITRQFGLVYPFLQSLRPIFNRLLYSILDDALIDSLGVNKEQRKVKGRENIEGTDTSYYLIEEVKTYQNNPKTRAFTNLVESEVDSIIRSLQVEIFQMLVANNIGKSKEEVQRYVKDHGAHLIGIVRNNLCDAYNQLSNKNLFDTKKYWAETGISYPEDWIEDQVFQLLKNCMKLRYSDFEA